MPYTLHVGFKSPGATPGSPNDYQSLVDVSGTPLSRGTAILLYASQCGDFPSLGPQQALEDPEWMTNHIAQIAVHLDIYVPDENFDGLIVIDYENWDLLWFRTDHNDDLEEGETPVDPDYHANWRAYSGDDGTGDDDAANITGYEAAGRAFYEATLARVKELRPLARVAFYGYPTKFYKAAAETAQGVIGYGDGQYAASDRNDTLSWLWEAEDFLAPNVYCLFQSVDDPDADSYQNTPAQDAEYIRSNVVEAIRLAHIADPSKEVIPVVSCVYQRQSPNPLAGVLLNQVNIAHQLYGPETSEASGVVVWYSVTSEESAATLEAYFAAVEAFPSDDVIPDTPDSRTAIVTAENRTA